MAWKLFKKKDEDDFGLSGAPFMPSNLPDELPPLPPPPRAPRRGGDFELPPLPRGREMQELPPLPRLEKKSLPVLPELNEEDFSMPEEFAPQPAMPLPRPRMQAMPMKQLPAMREEFAPHERATKVYVRLDKYRNILKSVGQMEAKLNELRQTLARLNDVKDKESSVITSWTTLLEDAKRTLDEVHERMPRAEEA